jgi:DNA-binding NarL/FixJ family response regulator
MVPKVRVLIVDDHPLVRLGLANALAVSDRAVAIGQAANGEEALGFCRSTRPDVVLLDVHLPGSDGLETLTRLRSEFAGLKVLMISVAARDEEVFRAAESGASGYVLKSADLRELAEAIVQVHHGAESYPPDVAERLAERRRRGGLSPRELQVLQLVVAGFSNKEIVGEMKVSEATVKLHISNMLAKLGVTDRTQAAVAAIRRGIVRIER